MTDLQSSKMAKERLFLFTTVLTLVSPLETADEASFILSEALTMSCLVPCFTV